MYPPQAADTPVCQAVGCTWGAPSPGGVLGSQEPPVMTARGRSGWGLKGGWGLARPPRWLGRAFPPHSLLAARHPLASWPGPRPAVPGVSSEPGAPGKPHRTHCTGSRRAAAFPDASAASGRCWNAGISPGHGPGGGGLWSSLGDPPSRCPLRGGGPPACSPPRSPCHLSVPGGRSALCQSHNAIASAICRIIRRSRQTGKGSRLILLCGN